MIEPLRCNASNIADAINAVAARYDEPDFDYILWENSEYLPTPTIVEAAQALYTRCEELKSSMAKVRSQIMDRAGRSRNVEAYLQRISRTEPLTVFDESVFTGTVDCVIVRKGQGKKDRQMVFHFKDGTEIPMTI